MKVIFIGPRGKMGRLITQSVAKKKRSDAGCCHCTKRSGLYRRRSCYHSLRTGNILSSHTVFFGGMGERLEITHHSYNWECFANGACDCAIYLAGKDSGFYTIKDVLHLD